MAEQARVGIIGGGWPGGQHAKGYQAAGGFKSSAVADLIPSRREKMLAEQCHRRKQYAERGGADRRQGRSTPSASACRITCTRPITLAALKAGKHVVCETPPAMNAGEAKKIEAAAAKAGKVVLYAVQRRFGGAEQAAKQAIDKGYAGDVYHARAVWMRTPRHPDRHRLVHRQSPSPAAAR